MTAFISAILAMIESILPSLGTSAATSAIITNVINVLSGALPFIVTEVEAVVPAVKNIIAALSNNPATNATQLQALQALDAQADALFDAAAAQTDADSAASGTPST